MSAVLKMASDREDACSFLALVSLICACFMRIEASRLNSRFESGPVFRELFRAWSNWFIFVFERTALSKPETSSASLLVIDLSVTVNRLTNA